MDLMKLIERVRELEEQYQKISTDRIELVKKENEVFQALNGAKVWLAFEQKANGESMAVPPTPPPLMVEKETKTAAVLQLIERRPGLRTSQLHMEMLPAGIALTRQHLYNTLARLTEDGRIEKREGGYFLTVRK